MLYRVAKRSQTSWQFLGVACAHNTYLTNPSKRTNVLRCLIKCLTTFKFYQTQSNTIKQVVQMGKMFDRLDRSLNLRNISGITKKSLQLSGGRSENMYIFPVCYNSFNTSRINEIKTKQLCDEMIPWLGRQVGLFSASASCNEGRTCYSHLGKYKALLCSGR